MKKIISIMLSVVLIFSLVNVVIAESKTPKVKVNDREIVFTDQSPVILEQEGRTLVPARGVFEAMGASVKWNEEKRMVTINSASNLVEINIVIDDPVMKVYTVKNLFEFNLVEVALDAAPQIMNDRTMIPLRAISESLDAKVEWDESTYTIDIATSDYKPVSTSAPTDAPTPTEAPVTTDKPSGNTSTEKPTVAPTKAPTTDERIKLSMEASKTTVEAGETFDVIVNVSDLPKYEGTDGIAAITASVIYDKSKFEYIADSAKFNTVGNITAVENVNFSDDSIKVIGLFVNLESSIQTDGEVLRLTFKSLTGESGDFMLSNRIKNNKYDVAVVVQHGLKTTSVDSDLVIDTKPIKIN